MEELLLFPYPRLSNYLLLLMFFCVSNAQQTYINNKQLDCYKSDSSTDGYLCNGLETSCLSYLTFRAHPPYDSASDIGYLLDSEPSMIAKLNNITDVDKIPTDTLVIVPIVNCSCSGSSGNTASFYQHSSSYILKSPSETYLIVANDTYQGLTTCQALIRQNPKYDSRNLSVGLRLSVPLRCACPTKNQISTNGVKFLLSYLVTWGDTISSIAQTFGVDDEQTIRDANLLSSTQLIYPFTPILVPLKTEPTTIQFANPPPPPLDSQPPTVSAEEGSNNKKWVFLGIGVGSFLLLVLSGFFFWLFRLHRRPSHPILQGTVSDKKTSGSAAVSSEGVRCLIDSSLNVYNFEDLQRACGYFSEDHIIKGSVYRGVIKGDNAAIKRMEGDVSSEINILKQINHSSVVRLSGFCMHQGNTYLVYEFAENGSLRDWLHHKKSYHSGLFLGWKQRIQIAYDVADGLNYLHNYATPSYIHKDLKSSNILLNGSFRAKIANFGLARTLDINEEEEEAKDGDRGVHLTRHVVGTKGYMAPEYLENGVVTPKMDVFAFGVVMLELLSGKEAVPSSNANNNNNGKVGRELLLTASIRQVLEGDDVREKLKSFIDPSLMGEYSLELAFFMAQLANNCVAQDLNSRPTMSHVFISLSKILSSSLDWDPSDELQHSGIGLSTHGSGR